MSTRRCKNVCAVATCPNKQGISYFCFPKDEERARIWKDLCNREDPVNVKTARICESHFKREDFRTGLKRKKLVNSAVPALFLTGEDDEPSPDHQEIPPPEITPNEVIKEKAPKKEPPKDISTLVDYILMRHPVLKATCSSCHDIAAENRMLNAKVQRQEKLLKLQEQKITTLVGQIRTIALSKANLIRGRPKWVEQELLRRFSRAKVNALLGKTKRPGNWTESEIVDSVVLKRMSPKVYKYIRKNNLAVLPGNSTLSTWTKNSAETAEKCEILAKVVDPPKKNSKRKNQETEGQNQENENPGDEENEGQLNKKPKVEADGSKKKSPKKRKTPQKKKPQKKKGQKKKPQKKKPQQKRKKPQQKKKAVKQESQQQEELVEFPMLIPDMEDPAVFHVKTE